MLVQKQTPERLKKILLYGGIPILLLGGYILYNNLSSGTATDNTNTAVQQKSAPKEFGQTLFRDPRFYALSPKSGTELITQATAVVPAVAPAAPEVTGFDVRTGGAVLFTWKMPAGVDATAIRVNRMVGDDQENLATLSAQATSFLFAEATDRKETTYVLFYIKQTNTSQSAQVPAKLGASNGGLSVTAADGAGVRLQWSTPANAESRSVEVYRSTTVGTLGKRIGTLAAGASSYEDAGGRVDLHFYTVVWVGDTVQGSSWTGALTSTDATPPEAPDFVTATYDAAQKAIRVTWAPSISLDVERYEVYRSDQTLSLGRFIGDKRVADISTVDQIATTTQECSKKLCVEDPQPADGTTLYYTVVAYDATGNKSVAQELGRTGRSNPFVPL